MNRSKRTRDRRTAALLPRRRLLAMNSDDRLVDLVIGGDDMAFELLYARHVADALAFADGLLGSREEAEQAVRHSFAAAHAYLADGGRKTAFEPWLYTILDNHCLSLLQRRRGAAEAPEDEVATVVDLEAWRRKRKSMGALLPIPPTAGFHDSVMTACGVGGGAASAAAPLLGGTLAKVAVVVVVAGGAGAAGNAVVSDQGGSVGPAQGPSPAVVDSRAALSAGGVVSELLRPGSGEDAPERTARSPRPGADGAEDLPPLAGEAPGAAAPIGLPPDDGAASAPAGVGAPALPAPTGLEAPAADVPALASPDEGSEALRRLGERVNEGLPTLGKRVKARLPSLDQLPVKSPKPPSEVETPNVELPPIVGESPALGLPGVVEQPDVEDDADVPVSPPA